MSELERMEDKLERLEELAQKVKNELEERQRIKNEEKSKRFGKIKKKRAEEAEREERKERKRKLEERWSLLRWVTEYIEENQERWEKDAAERKEEEKLRLRIWEKNSRLEKIRIIKERMRNSEKKRKEMDKNEKARNTWKVWRQTKSNLQSQDNDTTPQSTANNPQYEYPRDLQSTVPITTPLDTAEDPWHDQTVLEEMADLQDVGPEIVHHKVHDAKSENIPSTVLNITPLSTIDTTWHDVTLLGEIIDNIVVPEQPQEDLQSTRLDFTPVSQPSLNIEEREKSTEIKEYPTTITIMAPDQSPEDLQVLQMNITPGSPPYIVNEEKSTEKNELSTPDQLLCLKQEKTTDQDFTTTTPEPSPSDGCTEEMPGLTLLDPIKENTRKVSPNKKKSPPLTENMPQKVSATTPGKEKLSKITYTKNSLDTPTHPSLKVSLTPPPLPGLSMGTLPPEDKPTTTPPPQKNSKLLQSKKSTATTPGNLKINNLATTIIQQKRNLTPILPKIATTPLQQHPQPCHSRKIYKSQQGNNTTTTPGLQNPRYLKLQPDEKDEEREKILRKNCLKEKKNLEKTCEKQKSEKNVQGNYPSEKIQKIDLKKNFEAGTTPKIIKEKCKRKSVPVPQKGNRWQEIYVGPSGKFENMVVIDFGIRKSTRKRTMKKTDMVATPGNLLELSVDFENVTDESRTNCDGLEQETVRQERSSPGNATKCTITTGSKNPLETERKLQQQGKGNCTNQNVRKIKEMFEPGNKNMKQEEPGNRKGKVKLLAEVFSPVRNARKQEARTLGISPKGKVISKCPGNRISLRKTKGGKLDAIKRNFENSTYNSEIKDRPANSTTNPLTMKVLSEIFVTTKMK